MVVVFDFAQYLSLQDLLPAAPLYYHPGVTVASFSEADAIEIRKRFPEATEIGANETTKKTPEIGFTPYNSGHEGAFSAVCVALAKQDQKWGIQHHSPDRWLAILTEEVGECAKECNEYAETGAKERLIAELAQVAAVAIAAIGDLKQRHQ